MPLQVSLDQRPSKRGRANMSDKCKVNNELFQLWDGISNSKFEDT